MRSSRPHSASRPGPTFREGGHVQGGTSRAWNLRSAAVPVPESLRHRLGVTDSLALARRYPGISISIASLERQRGVPRFRDAVANVLLSPHGVAWLERVDSAGVGLWIALDSAGRVCAAFPELRNTLLVQVDDTIAWGLEWTPNRLSARLVRFRLVFPHIASGEPRRCT